MATCPMVWIRKVHVYPNHSSTTGAVLTQTIVVRQRIIGDFIDVYLQYNQSVKDTEMAIFF